jgi:hypothetical protein
MSDMAAFFLLYVGSIVGVILLTIFLHRRRKQ